MTRPINGVLVWKDGRRQETADGGGIKVIMSVHHEDGRWTQTTFDATGVEQGDVIVYVESETEDTTDRMHLAGERMRQQSMRDLGLRPSYAPFMTQGRYRGESDEGFARRIRVMKGEEE